MRSVDFVHPRREVALPATGQRGFVADVSSRRYTPESRSSTAVTLIDCAEAQDATASTSKADEMSFIVKACDSDKDCCA